MTERIYDSMIELVGKTPLVRLNAASKETNTEMVAKLEYFNPMSSIKDRAALFMIEDAEKKGLLNKNTTIVEPTSGNTGIGLAFISSIKGYKLTLTMPETMSIERRKLLKMLGAKLILTPGKLGMKGAVDEAEKIVKEKKNHIILQQFTNKANSEAHKKTTAIEILNDCNNNIDILVATVGTGGTISGIGKALKEKIPHIKIVAVEPADSQVLSGKKAGAHKIQGIGAGFIPEIYDSSVVDEIVAITSEEAFSESRNIAKTEGILCGISSGAAISGAKKIASRPENRGKRVVVIIPDTGERYLSTELFD